MEFSVKMQPELMMNTLWLIIGGILFLLSALLIIIIIIFKIAPSKAKVHKKSPVPERPKYVNSRQKALYDIDQIVFELSRSKIDTRESYQRLSVTIREYLTATTGKDHTCLTLAEIKQMAGEGPSPVKSIYNTNANLSESFDPKTNVTLWGYGTVNSNVVNVKAPDLRVTKIKEFAALIEGCYYPEFALKTKRDFRVDAEKAKRLVNTWS